MSHPATIEELYRYLCRELEKIHPPEEANAISLIILEHLLSYSRIELLTHNNDPISTEHWSKVTDILGELKQHKPIQYITGETPFYQCSFKVSSAVLIPRPETEELVHWIISSVDHNEPALNILDAGTGSGCIAVALSANLPHAKLFGCDLKDDILAMARQNATRNGVSVRFFQMDLLQPVSSFPEHFFHVIVSNPPYIPVSRKEKMQPEVYKYEPADALFVPDRDPLIFYRAILQYAEKSLREDGMIFFEVDESYAGQVAEQCKKAGYGKVEIRKDINGKKRMVRAIQR